MREINVSPLWAATKLDHFLVASEILIEMLVSETYTHSQKRAIAKTLGMMTKQLNAELVSDKTNGDLPF